MERGPVAPKDPTKKGAYFYIMLDKDIFGAPQPDGRGVQFIYENDNRLINASRIVGNINDEEILNLLKTTAGFRKLVHSIGVSVTEETQKEPVDFVFQMYGNKDTYGSGTSIRKSLLSNGSEEVILMDEVDWSEDDKEPGQIRFEFGKAEIQATASVRLYLREGFTAPEVILDEKIDDTSEDYKAMIKRSLMQAGNVARCKAAIEKAKAGKDVNIAFIGGSITQGAGAIPIHQKSYAYQCYRQFAEKYGTGDNVHLIKAGVGGTPSELGMIRFNRDILRDGSVNPDVIVIEFAVNDEGDETKGNCYESLVRKCLALPNEPAVILLFAVFSYDWNLQERLSPVGRNYDLPMVSVMDAVTPQFGLRKGEGRVLSKNQFFYDVFHPSNNGHKIMAECLMNLFEVADSAPACDDNTRELLKKDAVLGKDFEDVKLMDRKEMYMGAVIHEGSFNKQDSVLQCVEMDDQLVPVAQFPYNWHRPGKTNAEKDCFEMSIICKKLILVFKDSGDNMDGKADVYVDGEYVLTADPHINGWTHCNPVILMNQSKAKEHEIRIQMAEGEEEKRFTILGFGYVE